MAAQDFKPRFRYELGREQEQKAAAWLGEHRKVHAGEDEGAIGGRYTWTFTPTSLGDVVRLQCCCGAEVDLSEYENW